MLLLLMMMLDADADADAAGARVVHADVMCMCMCCTYVALCMSCAYDVHVLALLRSSYTPGPAYFQRARSERRRRTAHAALHRRGAPAFHAGARARSGRADS